MPLLAPLGSFTPAVDPPVFEPDAMARLIQQLRQPLHIVQDRRSDRLGLALTAGSGGSSNGDGRYALIGLLPALYPEWLGDRAFQQVHGLRLPYVAGAMANGIATVALVKAMARGGMLGFFGSAGLSITRVTQALDELETLNTEALPWGSNLIHSPQEPKLEEALVDLYLKRGVKRVSASAYMDLTPAVVRYAATGLSLGDSLGDNGEIKRQNYLFAKISRPEVARHFMSPAPKRLLDQLVRGGQLTESEARLALRVPLAEDITVESDSGGHTDNRPLLALFPTILRIRRELEAKHGFARPIRLGAAGGLGTPSSVASAFALGASYVLTGSVNQGAIESGLCEAGRKMLADAGLADVIMAPAADMFEMGVKVQVLRRGTMFGPRASKLYDLYQRYDSIEAMPEAVRGKLEKEIFAQKTGEVWQQCERFFAERDPDEVTRAERDPKHRMALLFRWYLGSSSRWAIVGDGDRRLDYQIWCGPAMGAFNQWVAGSFLEPPEQRTALQIALNLLEGAAVVTRAHQLRTYGVPVPAAAFDYQPRRIEER